MNRAQVMHAIRNAASLAAAAALAASVLAGWTARAQTSESTPPPSITSLQPVEVTAEPELDLQETNLARALELSRRTKRSLFIYAGADWCPYAARVRHIYLGRNAAVRRELANFVVVKLVGQEAERLTSYLDTGFPTVLTYDWQGRETWRAVGAPEVAAFVEGLQAAKRINDSGRSSTVPVLLGASSAPESTAPSVETNSFAEGSLFSDEREMERTSLKVLEDGMVELSAPTSRFVLRPDDYGVREASMDGRSLRFIEGEQTRAVEKVISNDGVTIEIRYRFADPGNPHSDRKIALIWLRPSTAEELALVGFPVPNQAPVMKSQRYSFEYDDNAKLVLAHAQEGDGDRRISLDYDKMGNLSEIRTQPTRRTVRMEYGENNKPKSMSGFDGKTSLGTITVEYFPNGGIKKVDSTSGRKVALQVTSAFQELLDAIRPTAALRTRYHGYY